MSDYQAAAAEQAILWKAGILLETKTLDLNAYFNGKFITQLDLSVVRATLNLRGLRCSSPLEQHADVYKFLKDSVVDLHYRWKITTCRGLRETTGLPATLTYKEVFGCD
jgi:hypothetical protein